MYPSSKEKISVSMPEYVPSALVQTEYATGVPLVAQEKMRRFETVTLSVQESGVTEKLDGEGLGGRILHPARGLARGRVA